MREAGQALTRKTRLESQTFDEAVAEKAQAVLRSPFAPASWGNFAPWMPD
jgi:hypothetical protein